MINLLLLRFFFETDFADKTCITCQPNCASCQDRPDYCTSCDHHLLLYQNKCLASCPIKTFETEDYTYVHEILIGVFFNASLLLISVVRLATILVKPAAVRTVRNALLAVEDDIGTKVDVLKNAPRIIMPIRNNTNAWNVHQGVRNAIEPHAYLV